MLPFFSRRTTLRAVVGWLVAAYACSSLSSAWAVSPESPEVKAMVKKGLAFLEGADRVETRLGGQCLIGLAFYKDGQKDHPRVKQAIAECTKKRDLKGEDNYSIGIAIMFLCDVDPELYRSNIETYLSELLSRQQEKGGWGYPGRATGDTSQTQYAALGLWMSSGVGLNVPIEAEEKVANWLLRTQDPNGGWGYQGVDDGSSARHKQSEVNGSLTSAGLGSLYIIADVLHITTPKEAEPEGPKALKVVKENQAGRQPRTNKVDRNAVLKALNEGNMWYPNHLKLEEIKWFYYYIYAFERYQSYREYSEGRFEKEPGWYNNYYTMLRDKQDPKEGFWHGPEEGKEISTAFAILFLLRSAKKAIVKVANLGDGVLLGGYGLPPNVQDLKEKDGKVVETELSGGIDAMMALLEDADNPDLIRLQEENVVIELSGDVTKRAGQITKLREQVSSPVFEARIVAVRSLGKAGTLDNVPILIYALTDPDLRVVREADKCLRYVSRKFEGFGFPADPKPTKGEIDKLRTNWKKWYLSIRPDAQLLD